MTTSSTLPRGAGGIQRRVAIGSEAEAKVAGESVAFGHQLTEELDLAQEIADLIDRICTKHGTQKVAAALDRGRSAVRQWVANPERMPLAELPPVLGMADPDDPFLPRLAAYLGYRLQPLNPTPEQIVDALREAEVLVPHKVETATRVVRGLKWQQPRLTGLE